MRSGLVNLQTIKHLGNLYSYNPRKLAPRALKGFFIGYLEGVNGYKIWCININHPKCIMSIFLIFNEKELLSQKSD